MSFGRLLLYFSIVLAFGVLVSRNAPAHGQVNDPDQPLVLSPLSSVDENLFALHFLADVYAHWPSLKGDRAPKEWFGSARKATSTMRGVLRARGLDNDLDSMYEDCLEYMSSTETYLANLELLKSQKSKDVFLDTLSSIWSGYKTAGDVTPTAKKLGVSDENAASAGQLIGAANALTNMYSKSQTRDATYRTATAEEGRKLEDKWNTLSGRASAFARKMKAKYSWAVGEAGFDGFQSPQMTDRIARSPRDPFLKSRYADTVLQNATTPENCIKATNLYLEAAQLVPGDSAYDGIRLQYVASAVEAAVDAPAVEAGATGYSSHPANWPSALKVARTYLAMTPPDVDGYGHTQLARALAFAGRYSEGASSATTALNINAKLRDDPGFAYRYAKLMCLSGRNDLVSGWLQQAFNDGYSQIKSLRVDPDFQLFKAQQAQSFDALTKVRWRWNIDFGVMLDDVVVANLSAFDLTNVKVQVHVVKGSTVWDRSFGCSSIKAGGTCKGENLMSVAGNSFDSADASLSSDQS